MEDIKILENYIYGKKETMKEQLCLAIENLINRNKELEKLELEHQKINGELRETVKEIEEDYTSVYLKGIYDERDKWKSKVKEKIEETNKEKLNYSEDEWYLESEIKGYAIEKMQELLEE